MDSKDLVIDTGPNDTQPIDPVKIPSELPATIARVGMRRNMGSDALAPIKIAVCAVLILKLGIIAGEFWDKSAGHLLPALLPLFLAASGLQLYWNSKRAHEGNAVPADSPGTPLLMGIIPLVQRAWPNPPWFMQAAFDRPYRTTSLVLEPLVWVIVALVAFRFPGETDGARAAAILALATFIHAYNEPWLEDQATGLTEQQAPASPSTFADGVALFKRLTKVATAPKQRQEQDSADDHTPAAV
jgi:hypothetical protein